MTNKDLDKLEGKIRKFYESIIQTPIGCAQHYKMMLKDLREIDEQRKLLRGDSDDHP